MPAAMILTYAPNSRAGRVRWLLEELGVPYELQRVTLYSPEMATPAYRAIHPLGKVPALSLDGRTMIESGAMLVYLADRFAERGLAPALDAPERPAYLQWIFFAATQLEPPMDLIYKNDDPAVKAKGAEEFHAAARVLEPTFGDGRPFLLGDRFTTADIAVGSVLGWARILGLLSDHPVLIEYGRRVGGRPAAKASRAD
jgi:glutathione S-transferase